MKALPFIFILLIITSCEGLIKNIAEDSVKPLYISDEVVYDTDDPAIWVNPIDKSKSLVIGTDKDANGGLYVFDLKGKLIPEKTIKNLNRPNNVDIAYNFVINGNKVDIAVTTERFTHKLRIYALPSMKPLDNGGISVFEGEKGTGFRDLMGISLYTDSANSIYAIVGRKNGPTDGNYLWQYLLSDNGKGYIQAKLVRKFGKYSGKKEIEAIAVDNEMGFVYYSDEQFGVRKYYADPKNGNQELAIFATEGFSEDNEGICIYKTSINTGYILVSDQSANEFKVYSREGKKNSHDHSFITSIKVSTNNCDGSDMVSIPLNNDFKHGLFVAMSDDKTLQFYRWEDLAKPHQLNF